jgi:hypothetical protein
VRTATVIIDSREDPQWRLPFPDHIKVHPRRSRNPVIIKIKTRVDKLDAGDYCLDGHASRCLVETKRSARELADNLLTDDFRRANAAFERFSQATAFPLLVCEFSQADLLTYLSDGRAMDALAWCIARHRLNVWFAGPRGAKDARRKTAECVLRLMLELSNWEELPCNSLPNSRSDVG